MANNYFQFKQFTIWQDKCAMKVCTDACLFGALVANPQDPADCPLPTANRQLPTANRPLPTAHCLDIGTGTGLLSLMFAQKNPAAHIDAVEIDPGAALQARENIAASPWAGRIRVFNEDILTFNHEKAYDYIFSNPPFFEDDLQSPDDIKNNAKHHVSLTLIQLLAVLDKQLTPTGSFAILLPYHRVEYFMAEAARAGFYLSSQVLVKQTPHHHFFRGILFFKRTAARALTNEISIKDGENNYTPGFTAALKDYYLYL